MQRLCYLTETYRAAQQVCIESGYPETHRIDDERFYCQRKVNGTDEVKILRDLR